MKQLSYIKHITVGLFFFVFLSNHSNTLNAQVTATATVSEDSIQIGEQFRLDLEVSSPKDIEVIWPRLLDSIGKFEIIGAGAMQSKTEGDTKIESQQYKLTSFDEGYYPIPGIIYKYKQRNRTKQVQTKGILMNVATVAVDTTQSIRPIKGIMEVPFTWKEAIPYVIKGLIALLALLGLLYFLRRYFKKDEIKEVIPPPPPPPAHETALKKLKEIENAKAWQNTDMKTYYSQLTDVLREYVEGRYDIPALESTSDEIMQELSKTDLQKGLSTKLQKLLMMADLAKFAKASPSPDDNKRNLKAAFDFVLHTKNRKEVVEEIEQNVEITKNTKT